MLLGVYPESFFSLKEGKTVDKYNFDTTPSSTRHVAWRLTSIFAAAFFAIFASASKALAAVEATTSLTDYIQCAESPANYSNADGNAARVFVTEKFVFVLEQYTHRIAVYDRAARTNLFYYGANYYSKNSTNGGDTPGLAYTDSGKWAYGTGEGAFIQPFGMALDTFSGENRFAVADTGNHRVQMFSFDPDTGDITFLAAYGEQAIPSGVDAAEGKFSEPYAVAFMPGGDLLVADTGNYRVARVSYAGGSWTWQQTFQFTVKSILAGICYGEGPLPGFWVADAGRQLRRVSFHAMESFSDTPVVSLGDPASGDFSAPRDVQLWTLDGRVLVAATDNKGSRVRLLDPLADGSGAYTDLVALGDIGSASDASLQDYEKLYHPVGIFPVAGTDVIYVADTGHNLVKWYSVSTSSEPPEPPKYFNFTSVKTLDENGEEANTFTNRQAIGLLVTFDTDDEIDSTSIVCKKEDGSTFVATTADNVSDNSLECEDISSQSQEYVGPIELVITVNCTGGTYTTNVVAAYTLVEPEQPVEEYEEVWWHTTSITVADETATLTWSMPTNAIPSDGKCDFRIDRRLSLTEGAWSADADSYVVEGVSTADECTKAISLSGIGNPASSFFRVFWTNKVKGVDP